MNCCCKLGNYCAMCDPGIVVYWQEKCKELRDAGYDPECFLDAKDVWWEYNEKIDSGEIKREDYAAKTTIISELISSIKNPK